MKNIKKKIMLFLLVFCLTALSAVTAMASPYSLTRHYPVENGIYYVNEGILIAVDRNFNWLVSTITYAASSGEQVPGIRKLSGDMPTFTLDILGSAGTSNHYDMSAFRHQYNQNLAIVFTPKKAGTYKLNLNVSPEGDGKYEVQDTRSITVVERTHETITTRDRPKIMVRRIGKTKARITCTNIVYASKFKMEVYRSTKKNGKYKLVKSIGKSTYTDKKLKASKTYYYKVRFVTEVDAWTTRVTRYSAVKAAKKK